MNPSHLSIVQRLVLILLGTVILVAATLFYQTYNFLHTSPEDPGQQVVIRIKSGLTFSAIASLLESRGVITNSQKFSLLGRIMGKSSSIRAGEFTMNTGWTPLEVLKELGRGRDILHPLTIPEGLTWWQVAETIQKSGLGSRDGFARIVRDRDFLAQQDIPGDSAEGYLFPETYLFPKMKQGQSATNMAPINQNQQIADRLVAMFWEKTSDLFPASMSPRDIRDMITLASLVEKETSRDSERARIAGVYANRLRKNMRLQCDPTIIYGIGPNFDGNLTRSHLRDRSNPYNTYVHPGLPPGPICSPGRASIHAALNPESHAYLYFVSKGDGSHVFSKTLEEHNRYVRKYQLRR